MFGQSRISSRVVAGVAVVAVAGTIGVILATGSGSGPGEEEPAGGPYAAEDVAGFLPNVPGYTYYDPTVLTAGEAWQQGWPDESETPFTPPECMQFVASMEGMLASDESQTAGDGLAFLYGESSNATDDVSGFTGAYVKTRTFSSASAAQDYVNGLKSNIGPCASGYGYVLPEGLTWSVDSVSATTTTLDGVGEVLVVDEQGLALKYSDDYSEDYPHYTHYVYLQENVIIIASFVTNAGVPSSEDAANLISQFVDYLGQL
jgi:hypothetical protein